PYLNEHIAQKERIYERYKDGLKDLPVSLNPYDATNSVPNFWLTCLLIDKDAMCEQVRSDNKAIYYKKPGHTRGYSCPTEIFAHLMSHNAQCRPIWKPMHLQPIYRMNPFVTVEGDGRGKTNAYINEENNCDVGADVFDRGLCLPSDNKMTVEQQDRIIKIIHRCFE
ncbi:MAG: aminotransferase DegT, partial [Anaerovoracaceae bacterium]